MRGYSSVVNFVVLSILFVKFVQAFFFPLFSKRVTGESFHYIVKERGEIEKKMKDERTMVNGITVQQKLRLKLLVLTSFKPPWYLSKIVKFTKIIKIGLHCCNILPRPKRKTYEIMNTSITCSLLSIVWSNLMFNSPLANFFSNDNKLIVNYMNFHHILSHIQWDKSRKSSVIIILDTYSSTHNKIAKITK